jgi:hypothetical protein
LGLWSRARPVGGRRVVLRVVASGSGLGSGTGAATGDGLRFLPVVIFAAGIVCSQAVLDIDQGPTAELDGSKMALAQRFVGGRSPLSANKSPMCDRHISRCN